MIGFKEMFWSASAEERFSTENKVWYHRVTRAGIIYLFLNFNCFSFTIMVTKKIDTYSLFLHKRKTIQKMFDFKNTELWYNYNDPGMIHINFLTSPLRLNIHLTKHLDNSFIVKWYED